MSNKLEERYQELAVELEAIQEILANRAKASVFQARVAELEAKQDDLKKTLLHFIALSKLRDEAWRALSYGSSS